MDDGFYIEDAGVQVSEDDREKIFEVGYSTRRMELDSVWVSSSRLVGDMDGQFRSLRETGWARFEITGVEVDVEEDPTSQDSLMSVTSALYRSEQGFFSSFPVGSWPRDRAFLIGAAFFLGGDADRASVHQSAHRLVDPPGARGTRPRSVAPIFVESLYAFHNAPGRSVRVSTNNRSISRQSAV